MNQDPGTAQELHRDLYFSGGEGGGSRNALVAAAVAVLVVCLALGAYVYFGQKPPVATGEILRTVVYPVHTLTKGSSAPGQPGADEPFDQILVFTEARIHNQSKDPLFVTEMATNVSLEDGLHTSSAAGQEDYQRAGVAYPGLAPLLRSATPLLRDQTIAPGQTVDAAILCQFHSTAAEWARHRDLNVTISFRYQKDLVLIPATVTESSPPGGHS
jgi:hypothetical protein